MTRRVMLGGAAALLVALAVALSLRFWGGEEAAIRERLYALRDLANTSTSDGLGIVAHAAEIGSFFTTDATIDFGAGSAQAHGRETVIGMAARLQPRTATFQVDLDDVTVQLTGERTADVTLTAIFRRRSLTTEEESMDAREFALEMSKADGEWRIARATAVETLKR